MKLYSSDTHYTTVPLIHNIERNCDTASNALFKYIIHNTYQNRIYNLDYVIFWALLHEKFKTSNSNSLMADVFQKLM